MEFFHQVSSLIYGALACFYLFFVMRRQDLTHTKAICKILPLFVLLFSLLSITLSHVAPFNVKSFFYIPRLRKAVMAVIFSIFGDVYLVYKHLFLFGVVCFAIAQGFMLFAFSEDLFIFAQVRTPELISLLIIATISLFFYVYLFPKMKCVMSILALLYTALFTIMLWSAVMQVQKYVSMVTVGGAIGAGLFYISDVTLSINKWRGPLSFGLTPEFIMATYYAGQYMIVFSLIYSD